MRLVVIMGALHYTGSDFALGISHPVLHYLAWPAAGGSFCGVYPQYGKPNVQAESVSAQTRYVAVLDFVSPLAR